jgi:hypothetical protein
MQLEECLAAAHVAATSGQGTNIAVVNDPIGNAEEDGDYGYCPVSAVAYLHRFGEITHTIDPSGKVETLDPPVKATLLQPATPHTT